MEHSSLKNVRDQIPGPDITTKEFIERIQGDRYKSKIVKFRVLKATGDKKATAREKTLLPAIVATGICKGAVNDSSLVYYNQKICVDLDKLTSQGKSPSKIREALNEIPWVEAAAISCGGDGVFAFVKHTGTIEDHARVSTLIADAIEYRIGVKCDRTIMKVKSSRRLVSYDPDAWYNPDAIEFEYVSEEVQEKLLERKQFTDQVKQFEEGSRNAYLFQYACNCKTKGISQSAVDTFSLQYFECDDFDENEISKAIRSGYKTAEVHESAQVSHSENGQLGKNGTIGKVTITPDVVPEGFPAALEKSMFPRGKIFDLAQNLAFDEEQKAVMCLSLMTIISACLQKNTVQYSKRYYPNMYMGIVAPAGSGKGIVDKAISITDKLDQELQDECAVLWANYRQKEKKEGEKVKKPDRPECTGLRIPDDASTASFLDAIKSAQGTNLETTTEVDTKVRSNRGDLMIKDDVYRKAFEHERIHKTRKSDDEPTIIKEPKLSILMAGTYGSYNRLFPHGTEDGTMSRFLFYSFGSAELTWKSQFGLRSDEYQKYIDEAGSELVEIYTWNYNHPFEMTLSEDQVKQFDAFFNALTKDLTDNGNEEMFAAVKRLAVSTLRMACVMQSVVRYENQDPSDMMVCDQKILDKALDIAGVLKQHTEYVYSQIDTTKQVVVHPSVGLLNKLPDSFKSSEAQDVAKTIGIGERTCRNYLATLAANGRLERIKSGHYKKIIKPKTRNYDSITTIQS